MTEMTEIDRRRQAEDPDAVAIGRVYAEALIDQAAKQNQVQETLDELEALLSQVFQAHPDLEEFLTGDALGRESKGRLIDLAFKDRSSDLLFKFLHVLNEHDRLGLIRPITNLYRLLLEKRRGQIRVLVRSAVPLGVDQRERLRGELREAFHREPVLEEQVDPELLGGLVVRVGDWLYDASIRTRLGQIQEEIVEKGSLGIQSERNRFRVGG